MLLQLLLILFLSDHEFLKNLLRERLVDFLIRGDRWLVIRGFADEGHAVLDHRHFRLLSRSVRRHSCIVIALRGGVGAETAVVR